MNISILAAVLCLMLWVGLAFVIAVPSGWVHVPLAVGTVLLALGIVQGNVTGSSEG